LATWSPLAVAAGVYFMIHIALVKTSLFLLAGVAERATGSADLREMGGLLRGVPVVALFFLVMALALAGVPPLSGFYAKLGLVLAAVEAGEYAVAGAALATSLLTLYVVARVWTLAFMRAKPEEGPAQLRADGALLAPAAGLSTLAVTAALLAAPALALAQRAAAQLVDTAPYIAAVLGG
jgi:multicomponent Na+:H+ antiporter subunit D